MITQILIGATLFISAAAIGIGGFGFNLLSVAMLTFFLPIKFVVPLSMNYSIILNTVLLISCYKYLHIAEMKFLLPAMVIGVLIGVLLLSGLNEVIIRRGLGVIITGYCVLSVTSFFRTAWRITDMRWAPVFGLVAGCLAGAFGIGGPAVVVYVNGRRIENLQARTILLASAMFMQAITIPLYAVSGIITENVLLMNLIFSPFVAAGVYFGNRIFQKLKYEIFHTILLIILFIQGVLLLTRQ